MAPENDNVLTLLSQGKFIHSADRLAIEARARALRAQAVRELAQATFAGIHAWFARPAAMTRHDPARHQAA